MLLGTCETQTPTRMGWCGNTTIWVGEFARSCLLLYQWETGLKEEIKSSPKSGMCKI